MNKQAKIFIAGHLGLIGSAVKHHLVNNGFSHLLLRTRKQLDLSNFDAVTNFFMESKPDYVILAAGYVGGIIENQTYPADFMIANVTIQTNIIRAAHNSSVNKLILFGSSCMYPRDCAQPMSEDVLLTGKPEISSLPYAISKMLGVYMCLAYNTQYSKNRFIPLIPNSAYGENDNFDLNSGHVLSVLINRFHTAKLQNAKTLTLWGSGEPRREFVHSSDIADACLFLLSNDNLDLNLPLNIGVGFDLSIKELAENIADVVGYTGDIKWDLSKPDGAPRKLLDSSRVRALGWKPRVKFSEGLKSTYEWYIQNLPCNDKIAES